MDALEVIVKQTDDKISQLKDHLSSGRATSFEEYKSLCGEIRGLLIARGYALDLKDVSERDDD
jgi:hypothetical protein